ncbi:MAG: metallophosphoesterase family protein [Mycoplasma sp.]
MIYLITDTHFNHKKIEEYDKRELNWQEKIINEMIETFDTEDEIYWLGDVIFSQMGELKNILGKIKGNHFLIKGNHDKQKDNWYLNQGFLKVYEEYELDGVKLIHWDWNLIYEDRTKGLSEGKITNDYPLTICGHLHPKEIKKFNNRLIVLPPHTIIKFDDIKKLFI